MMCINALLLGLPKSKLKRIQLAQNAAARLIKGLRKNDHITPVLKDMHWLPIEQRILKIFRSDIQIHPWTKPPIFD